MDRPSPPAPEASPFGAARPAPRVNVLGVGVSVLDLAGAVRRVRAAIEAGERGYVCVCDAHAMIECQGDAELRRIYRDAFLVTSDGMPLVRALRRAGHPEAGRVYGPDLMKSLVCEEKGLRHYLYGTTEATLQRLEAALRRRAPDAAIVGTFSPPFRTLNAREEADIAQRIDAATPDIVWVGLSAPKQERWMARMRPRLAAPMLIGVGAAFDFHAGNKRQAPLWMRERSLEWAFRLASEPRRLGRRYAATVPHYLYLSALQRLGLRRFPLVD